MCKSAFLCGKKRGSYTLSGPCDERLWPITGQIHRAFLNREKAWELSRLFGVKERTFTSECKAKSQEPFNRNEARFVSWWHGQFSHLRERWLSDSGTFNLLLIIIIFPAYLHFYLKFLNSRFRNTWNFVFKHKLDMEIASNDYNDSEKSKAKAFGEKHICFNIHSTSRFCFFFQYFAFAEFNSFIVSPLKGTGPFK